MSIAKVLTLDSRPSRTSHLCFETGGILGELNVRLGSPVTSFDFNTFYNILASAPTTPTDAGRLNYDYVQILGYVGQNCLAALRAEPSKMALNRAINSRANTFYAKYANTAKIIAETNLLYDPSGINSKTTWLNILSDFSGLQADKLSSAYTSDGRTDVVKSTSSTIQSHLDSKGKSLVDDETSTKSVDQPNTESGTFFAPPTGGYVSTTTSGDDPVKEDVQMGVTSGTTLSAGTTDQQQTILNTDYAYRLPLIEALAQNARAQISLGDEKYAEMMRIQNLPYLANVFQNELISIDDDVVRIQIAFLNTLLMSPITGIVTGIYKGLGEAVRAGETVIRVEDDTDVHLVATLIYRHRIALGNTVTVKTSRFDSTPTTIKGEVVAARGLRDDDQWEVVISCNNRTPAGHPIVPIGYHFDYDDTTVHID